MLSNLEIIYGLGILCCRGSFAVRDHSLSNLGIISGRGSFAVLCSTLSSRTDHTQATTAGPFPCHRPRCRTCDFTERTATVTNASGDVRLKGRFDCTVAGVVYVITCQRCYKLYVCETGRKLTNRFGEHLRSVGVSNRTGIPVAEHFNLPGHNQVHDM